MTFDVIPSTPRPAPELAEGHLVLGYFFEDGVLDFTRAHEAFERALALAPGDATVLRLSGDFLVSMGRQFDEGMLAAIGRRFRPMQTSSPLIPRFKSPTEFAGLPTMGSMTLRTHALHVRASRTTGQPSGAGSGIRQDWTAHRRGAEPRFQAIERQLKFPS
jgi:hypothetical protein